MLKDLIIFKNITFFILPYIFLYGLYIQINGEVSPGGGFQAGVIFASSLIAFDLMHGDSKFDNYLPLNILVFTAAFGVMIYAGTGAISLIFDQNYLNYYALVEDRHLSQTIGIFSIEIGVGLTVSSVMCMIYRLFQDNRDV